jgi:cellulose biosynthesis protein BcsQ
MKKVLFITEAKGGAGKTLIARYCEQALAHLRNR